MKPCFLLTLLLLSQFCSGQWIAGGTETNSRMAFAGTKYSIVVPKGYTKAANFTGFQNKKTGSSILLIEIPGSFETVTGSFTAEGFRSQGMELISSETVPFNDDSARLLRLKQNSNGVNYDKMILVFGDRDKTVMVNAIRPENANEDEPRLREALFSITWNKEQDDDPLNAAAFTVNTEGSGLKVVKYIAGTLFFSEDGNMPTETATLIVGSSQGTTSIADQKAYAEQRLKKLPRGEFNVIRKTAPVTIDSLNGYEIIASGKTATDKPELVYLTMLFNPGGGYIIIIGNARQDFSSYEEKFSRIARTFRRK